MSEKRIKYYINGIHRSFGTFNEFTFDFKLAKEIALNLTKDNYFIYVEVSVDKYYSKYYLEAKNKHFWS